MKKTIILTLTTLLLLLNCSNNEPNAPNEPPIPCKDENCITDEQLAFFRGHIASIDTKQKLYEATNLDLSNNSITSLDTGIFNNLTSLTELNLSNNQLTTLPAGIFSNLTKLTALLLYDNQLTSIPDGIFTKLTNLTALWLKFNSSDTNTFTCDRAKYTTWGLPNPIPTSTLNLICTNN